MGQTLDQAEAAEDQLVHAGIRTHVKSEAEFREAVEAGIASAAVGPNRDLETVASEVRRALQGR